MVNALNKKPRKQNIGIATLDPKAGGGVLQLVKYIYNLCPKLGFKPFLIYNSLDKKNSLTLKRLLRGKSGKKPSWQKNQNLEGYSIPRILPEFEFLHYLSNFFLWKKVLKQSQIFLGISGTNQCALALAILRKKFVLWIASCLKEDREARVQEFPFFRKVADKIFQPFLFYFEKKIFQRADKILALSQATGSKIKKRYPQVAKKTEVIPFPIDTEFFKPISNKNTLFPQILFIARINDPRKNIPMLIKAFFLVQKGSSKASLIIAGEKPKKDYLVLAKKLNLRKKIQFPGNISRKKIRNLCQRASIFVVPSFQEGLCIAALEAMACGVPVVATRCGGPEDFILSGKNGWLVKNNDPQALAKAILDLLKNPQKRKKMGQNARETIVKNYSRKALEPKLARILKELTPTS